MQTLPQIGFKSGELCENAVRTEILFHKEGEFFMLNKPAGVDFDVPASREFGSVITCLRQNLEKPELAFLKMQVPTASSLISRDVSGACIVACNKDTASALKNACGSHLFNFEFLLVCRKSERAFEPFEVDLPILTPYKKEKAVITHNFGKKCTTQFTPLKENAQFQLWSAKSTYLRRHQIRLHASAGGLKILGDTLYSQTPFVKLSSLKKGYKKFDEERPLYPFIAIHSAKISFSEKSEFGAIEVSALPSKKFNTLLGKLLLA